MSNEITRREFLKRMAVIWGIAVTGIFVEAIATPDGLGQAKEITTCTDCGNGPCHPYYVDWSLKVSLFED